MAIKKHTNKSRYVTLFPDIYLNAVTNKRSLRGIVNRVTFWSRHTTGKEGRGGNPDLTGSCSALLPRRVQPSDKCFKSPTRSLATVSHPPVCASRMISASKAFYDVRDRTDNGLSSLQSCGAAVRHVVRRTSQLPIPRLCARASTSYLFRVYLALSVLVEEINRPMFLVALKIRVQQGPLPELWGTSTTTRSSLPIHLYVLRCDSMTASGVRAVIDSFHAQI